MIGFELSSGLGYSLMMPKTACISLVFLFDDSRKGRELVPSCSPFRWKPFEAVNAYPNRRYQLSGYKDVNKNPLKLYHSVNATASKCLHDQKGMSDADAGIPSSVDKECLHP